MDWCAGLACRPGMEAAVSALAKGRLTLLAVVKMTSRRAHMCASALGCFSSELRHQLLQLLGQLLARLELPSGPGLSILHGRQW